MIKKYYKRYLIAAIVGILGIAAGISAFIYFYKKQPIKLGILHSLTGSQAISERAVVDAEIMAIEEINTAGGIGGRKIIPIIRDGKSDEMIFAQEAERLISEKKVDAIIGCINFLDRHYLR